MIKEWFERLTGIDKIREEARAISEELQEARIRKETALAEAKEAEAQAAFSKLSAKEQATAKGEPYISVLETHVNTENIRNGFFELDWNDVFIAELKKNGYGFDGDPEEEIVDRWFRVLCSDVAKESGIDMSDRGAGYINVKKITQTKSEIS